MRQVEMRKKMRAEGFTLLEILVVVAIMGFLVAMVAPRFAGVTQGTIQVVGGIKISGKAAGTWFRDRLAASSRT